MYANGLSGCDTLGGWSVTICETHPAPSGKRTIVQYIRKPKVLCHYYLNWLYDQSEIGPIDNWTDWWISRS